MSTPETTETDHAKAQAKAQYESICEMVAYLDEEEGAERFASKLSLIECANLLEKSGLVVPADADDLREAVANAIKDEEIYGPDHDEEFHYPEGARERIQGDALEVAVRSGWYSPGSDDNDPQEFFILLCTGGPACRIRGELNQHGEPDRAWLEYQDWGTPWTKYFDADQDVLLAYSRQFCFGCD